MSIASEREINVLHVDDDPALTNLSRTVLQEEDDRFSIETATSAQEAMTLIAGDSPDCVVSDYDMPGRDGIELLRSVRENCPELPFILFTGKGSETVASEAISAGVTDYLQKTSGTEQYELLANRIVNAVCQVHAQRQLEEERQRVQILFDRLSQPTVEIEHEGDESIVKRVNQAFEETFGYEAADIVGEPIDAYLVPEDWPTERVDINRRARDDTVVDSKEVARQTADGTREFLLQYAVYDDESGGFVTYTDITERKLREQELKRKNTRLRALFEHFPEPTVAYEYRDGKAHISDANEAFTETFGYTPETAVGTSVNELIVPPDRLEKAQRITDRVKAGDRIDNELTRETASGRGDFRFRNIRLPEENSIDGYGIYSDITEYKKRERELKRQNDLFEKAQDIADVGAWEYDVTTEEIRWTSQVHEIHGRTQDTDLTTAEALEFYHPEDRPVIRDAVSEAIETGTPYDIEARIITTAGDQRWIRTRGDPQMEDDRVVRVRGTVQDITERKTRERELRQQNERLNEFTSIVSHDLRQPLNIAAGRLEFAMDDCDSSHLSAVADAHERMKQLIRDLLALAQAGSEAIECGSVNLPEVVTNCWSDLQDEGATVVVDTEQTICADRSRLQQLVENLLLNAVTHGGSNVTVRVGDLADGFYIEDDGKGIPTNAEDDVFEAGYSHTSKGTGFGLSIVNQVSKSHGWTVHLDSSDTGGARFEVTGVATPE